METIEQAAFAHANNIDIPVSGMYTHNEAMGIAYKAFKEGVEFAEKFTEISEDLPNTGETFIVKFDKPKNFDGYGESSYGLNIRISTDDIQCRLTLQQQGVVGWRRIITK